MANNQLPTKINKVSNEEQINSYLNLINKIQVPEENLEQNNRMGIITFIFLLICAGLLDLIDIIEFTGIGIAISLAASLLMGLVFNVLLFLACQKTNMKTATKLAATLGNYIVESIPGIDVLPINMIAVIICYILSNPEAVQKIKKMSSKTLQITGKVVPQAKQIEAVTTVAKHIDQQPIVNSFIPNSNQQALSKPEVISPKIIKAQNYE